MEAASPVKSSCDCPRGRRWWLDQAETVEVDRRGIPGILIYQRWSRQDLLSDGRWGVTDGFKVFALCMDKGHTGAEMVRL